MKVISLINGSLISETSSIYALHYAKVLNYKLILVHINGDDSMDEIEKSVKNIRFLANKFHKEVEFLTFETMKEFKKFVETKEVDMLFCSTKDRHSLFDKSFVKSLLKKKIDVDLAVVKVVKLCRAESTDKIILPIRESKLSIKKFTLFSTFSLAYGSKSEIYSIDKISEKKLSEIDISSTKERLQEIIIGLRHYLRLSKLMDFKFSIKHDFALLEGDRVKEHIAKHGYDLAIIGAHHKRNFFGNHPIDVLFDKPMINTIFFIPFKDNQ